MLQNTSEGHKAQANPTCDPGTKYNSRTTNQQQAMIATQNLAYNHPHPAYHCHSPCPLKNSLPHPLCNISPLIRIPFHCTLILHHFMLSLYNQPILNPYSIPSSSSNFCAHTPNTLSYFSPHCHPTSIPHLNTQDWYQRVTQRGTTVNDHNISLWEVMHDVQQQLNNMMAVMSPPPASWGKPTYTQ